VSLIVAVGHQIFTASVAPRRSAATPTSSVGNVVLRQSLPRHDPIGIDQTTNEPSYGE
jgi:hypothetical protein